MEGPSCPLHHVGRAPWRPESLWIRLTLESFGRSVEGSEGVKMGHRDASQEDVAPGQTAGHQGKVGR